MSEETFRSSFYIEKIKNSKSLIIKKQKDLKILQNSIIEESKNLKQYEDSLKNLQ